MEECGTLFNIDRNDIQDCTGCLLKQNHKQSAHICQDIKGNYYEWDYDWSCGCDDCRTDDINDMCIVYKKISNKEFKTKMH